MRRFTACAVFVLLLTGCPADDPPEEIAEPAPTPAEEPEPDPPPEEPDPPSEEPDPVPLEDVRVALEPFADGFDQPIYVTAPDGDQRLFVLERGGRVWVLDGEQRELFLDISGQVRTRVEEGLLGMAFHPGYADNGRFFIHYSDTAGDNVRAEAAVSDDPHVADPDSLATLLTVDQPASNHNGGMIAFGPDGMLYIALGDGGGGGDTFGHGQRADTLLGTILRLDVDAGDPYAIPSDNPFADSDGGAPEVWHYGLRNPWRFAFDGEELYIADVGQDRLEEINVIPAGEGGRNFGWPIMEGSQCFDPPEGCPTDGLVMPVLEYPIRQGPCAIIGGDVYRGEAIDGLQGHYLYTDYCAGFVRSFRFEDGQAVDERDWTDQTGTVETPYSFGRDAAGELYVTETDTGRVLRLVAAD
jgi:glucose/arabinose dehydrogenase